MSSIDNINRLLKKTRKKERTKTLSRFSFEIDRNLLNDFKRELEKDSVTGSLFMELVVKAYIERHPAILLLIDEMRREEKRNKPQPKSSSLSKKQQNEIYDEIGSGIINIEDNK